MRKKLLFVLLLAALLTISPIGINNISLASNDTYLVSPLWNNIRRTTIGLTNNGNNLIIDMSVSAVNSTSYINSTIFLEKYSNGRWSTEASWTVSDTGNIVSTKSYYGTKGVKYRARLRATVNGETSTAISSSIQL